MESFLHLLRTSKTSLTPAALGNLKAIHVVLGNESVDLDSTICALAFGWFLYESCVKNAELEIVLPVINTDLDNFLLRGENCHVLKENGVPLDVLTFRNELEVLTQFPREKIKTYLVDHHILSKNDNFLSENIVQIVDHRPVDQNITWGPKIKTEIEQVASCSTLVANQILETCPDKIFPELAKMLYCTIIFDSIGLDIKHGKTKELDLKIGKTLEDKFNLKMGRKKLYDQLWKVHNDVGHLTPLQLLHKDLKYVGNIPLPGLPMLVSDFVKIPNFEKALMEFSTKNNAPLIILVGLDASIAKVQRDVGIFDANYDFTTSSSAEHEVIKHLVQTSKEKFGFEFDFESPTVVNEKMVFLRQKNTVLSRKQITPVVKFVLENN